MDRAAFFDGVRPLFGGKLSTAQVAGMEGIIDAFDATGDGSDKTLAYAMATAFHETGKRMVPVREGFAKTDAQARRIVAGRRYGQVVNGHVFYGRGLVQMTWADNYKASSADAGVNLYNNPDAMLDPVISARVLIRGLMDGRWNAAKKGIAAYLPDNGTDDLMGARRTVNITDRWEMIGGYYQAFLAAVRAAGGVNAAVPKPSTDTNTEAIRALVQWRAEAPANLNETLAWLGRMP